MEVLFTVAYIFFIWLVHFRYKWIKFSLYVGVFYCSLYAFARKFLDLSGHEDVPITRIVGTQWSRASTPPAYAPLQNLAAAALGIELRPWEEALADYMATHG